MVVSESDRLQLKTLELRGINKINVELWWIIKMLQRGGPISSDG